MPEFRLHRRMQQAVNSEVAVDVTTCATSEFEDFDALVGLYWPRIFRFALASLRDRDGAESVAQDCFLKAWQARERFRGDCGMQTWLMQIAVNLVRDRVRSRRLQFWKSAVEIDSVSQWIPDGTLSPEAQAAGREQIAAVWQATAKLSGKQRTVFLLRFVEEMDLLEIAAVTGMPEGTVKIHLFRALEAIRKRLGKRR